ncbi:MAG TPA: hypothetical protein DCL88_07605, partial [Gammaproteobacteria bacterium]|nr:hypothetical protein [Gammaproteobacteria bacterium]
MLVVYTEVGAPDQCQFAKTRFSSVPSYDGFAARTRYYGSCASSKSIVSNFKPTDFCMQTILDFLATHGWIAEVFLIMLLTAVLRL